MEWLDEVDYIIGEIKMLSHGTAISNWLECNGQSLSKTTYSQLFNAIGTTWGSVDNNHFNLPDCRGKTIIGYIDGNETIKIGNSGGTETINLNIDQLPSHKHYCVNLSFIHGGDLGTTYPYWQYEVRTGDGVSLSVVNTDYILKGVSNDPNRGLTSSVGSSTPVSIMQSHIVLSARIFAGV